MDVEGENNKMFELGHALQMSICQIQFKEYLLHTLEARWE
jgi:hypothetical protein